MRRPRAAALRSQLGPGRLGRKLDEPLAGAAGRLPEPQDRQAIEQRAEPDREVLDRAARPEDAERRAVLHDRGQIRPPWWPIIQADRRASRAGRTESDANSMFARQLSWEFT